MRFHFLDDVLFSSRYAGELDPSFSIIFHHGHRTGARVFAADSAAEELHVRCQARAARCDLRASEKYSDTRLDVKTFAVSLTLAVVVVVHRPPASAVVAAAEAAAAAAAAAASCNRLS